MERPHSIIVGMVCLVAVLGCERSPESPPTQPPGAEAAVTPDPETVAAPASRADLNLDERGRALRGFDPVAYHTEGKAISGDETINETWDGAEYIFATEANREAFVAEPERYLPAHGGFCTFGIVLEKKFDGDPEVWLLRDDELHVFLNEEVRGKFMSDEAGNLARVEANWPQIRDRTAQELEEASPPGGASES